MPRPIEVPADLADLLSDPKRVRDAFALLNALASPEIHLVPPGNVPALSPGVKQIRGEPPNLIYTLPLMFTRSIADSAATVGSVSTQLNLLLAELRKTRQNPG